MFFSFYFQGVGAGGLRDTGRVCTFRAVEVQPEVNAGQDISLGLCPASWSSVGSSVFNISQVRFAFSHLK